MAGCGCAAGFPMSNSLPAGDIIIGHTGVLQWGAFWSQPGFPSSPCVDPHTIKWQFRQIHPVVTGFSLAGINAGVDCTGIKTKAVNIGNGGTTSQLANSVTWYYRDFFACEEGIYELRIRHSCGAGHWSGVQTRILRVRRLHSNL